MPFKGYRVTSPFGYRTHPITGVRGTFHTGIDLVKYHRAPINAFTAGIVLFAGMGSTGSGFGGYGNVVFIQDKNGRGQVYAHLDSVNVRRGQRINKGHIIGRQGKTGNTTGSHLHFEVRKTAPSTPPYGWIADRANNSLNPTIYLKSFGATAVKNSSSRIRTIQSTLNRRYNTALNVDGIYGPQTKRALIKGYQTELNKQFNAGLTIDGIWGPRTQAATVTIRRNARGNLTWILQATLYALGYNPNGLDGIFGAGTEKAVRDFQRDKKIKVDGEAGRNTFAKMFR
ncbi:peptidoglycan-binding protein [Oceanobacillus polygoni]|uniref:Peptidoglycan hydrolase-like protein with peptidoglycan-binding domain n=1 Tax=Oceanobacillus polygoni TaxID=1235259 RepID=A0A9X0YVA8_9BACI|nr:peptidoglycan-binding protein [Oceanobacillus polygoni]MBP2077641.1 peptidoglycan hydrolase-like protein with peptidoglycan-binding domain [Oceanobacillus polygoni]